MEESSAIKERLLLELEEVRKNRGDWDAVLSELKPQKGQPAPHLTSAVIRPSALNIAYRILFSIITIGTTGYLTLTQSNPAAGFFLLFFMSMAISILKELDIVLYMNKDGFELNRKFRKWDEFLGFRLLNYQPGYNPRARANSLMALSRSGYIIEYDLGELPIDKVSSYFYYYSKTDQSHNNAPVT